MSKVSSVRRSRQPGTAALDWLDHHPGGAQLLRTAREFLAIEAALATALPPTLARHVRVARWDGPEITAMVPGPAHASRLRQLTTAAAARLQEAGWPVTRIVVRVDAGLGRQWTQRPVRETRPLDAQALESFEDLGRQVAPGPLADAISRLLRHHRQ